MERFLNLMKGILYSWMSPNSVNTAMDLSIAILCGVGLFFLLITFLKDCPLSPASGNKTDIPKVRGALVHTQWSSKLLFMTVTLIFPGKQV